MTKKQMLTFLGCWLLTIGAIGLSLSWSFKYDNCNLQKAEITSSTDIQDQRLYNYGYLSALDLDHSELKKLKQIINLNEQIIKKQIEMFAESCKLKIHKDQLASMLTGFEYYLSAKNGLFGDYQDFSWIRNFKED